MVIGKGVGFRDLIGIIKDKASQSKALLISSNSKTQYFHLSLLRATTHDPSEPPDNSHIAALLSAGCGSRATAGATVDAVMERYALYLEHVLSTSRVLGFFLCSASSTTAEKDRDEERVSSLTNNDLLKEIDTLVSLLEESCRIPDLALAHGKNLVREVARLVGEDYVSAISEISVRVGEFKERLGCLSFSDSVELVCALKRLDGCKGRLLELWNTKRGSVDGFWCLISEVKGMVGNKGMVCGDSGKVLVSSRRREKGSESARLSNQIIPGHGGLVRLSSASFSGMTKFDFPGLESTP